MTKSEALRLAREALTWISDVYVGEDDDAGECASCHERSYLPHAPDCKKQAALAAIDAALAEHGKLPELPKPVLESHDASDGTLRFTARSELLMVDGTGLYTADQMRAYGRACAEAAMDALEVLRSELAQRGEPVAWINQDDAENALLEAINNAGRIGNPTDDKLILEHLKKRGLWIGNYTAPPQRDEPVAWIKDTSLRALQRDEATVLAYPRDYLIRPAVPLYTGPQKRKPLSKEQVLSIISELGFAALTPTEIARAIERAHGIGGDDGQKV